MRLALVGIGRWGRNWAELVQDAPDHDLIAVIEPEANAREWAITSLKMRPDRVFADLESGLATPGIDGVVILTPPDTHRLVAEAALSRNLPVLIEKPLATELADAVAIAETAERVGQIAMVSQNYRYSRPARAIRAAILAGQIGNIQAIRAVFRYDMRDHLPAGDFRFTMRHPLLFDMTIHHFDLLRAFTGLEATEITAKSWHVVDAPFAHHSAAVALLTLENGAVVSYDGDWGTHRDNLPWSGEWEFVGAEGRMWWDGTGRDGEPTAVHLLRWGAKPSKLPLQGDKVDSRLPTLDVFAEAIGTGTPPETSARDNVESLGLVYAATTSADTGQMIQPRTVIAAADSSVLAASTD